MNKTIPAVAIALVLSLGTIVGTANYYAYAQAPTFPSCDPSYDGGVCIPPKPPDLDCIEISERNIQVVGNDPHDLDRDSDGIGCEAPSGVIGETEPTPTPEAEEPTPIPVEPEPTPEVPPVIPAENETQSPEPETEPTPEAEGPVPFPPQNETEVPPIPIEIPIEVNETIPIPVPPNTTTGNETEPVQLPINETETPTGENETVDIPALPVEPPQQPTGDQGNQTEQLPEEIPAANETDTIPIEIPINSTTGNETIPVPPIEVTPPPAEAENATGTGENAAEQEQNATQLFDNLVNASAILDERLGETGDDANETQRADLKAAIGESLGAMGETKDLIVNATNDQLVNVQDAAGRVSEAIDVVMDEGE